MALTWSELLTWANATNSITLPDHYTKLLENRAAINAHHARLEGHDALIGQIGDDAAHAHSEIGTLDATIRGYVLSAVQNLREELEQTISDTQGQFRNTIKGEIKNEIEGEISDQLGHTYQAVNQAMQEANQLRNEFFNTSGNVLQAIDTVFDEELSEMRTDINNLGFELVTTQGEVDVFTQTIGAEIDEAHVSAEEDRVIAQKYAQLAALTMSSGMARNAVFTEWEDEDPAPPYVSIGTNPRGNVSKVEGKYGDAIQIEVTDTAADGPYVLMEHSTGQLRGVPNPERVLVTLELEVLSGDPTGLCVRVGWEDGNALFWEDKYFGDKLTVGEGIQMYQVMLERPAGVIDSDGLRFVFYPSYGTNERSINTTVLHRMDIQEIATGSFVDEQRQAIATNEKALSELQFRVHAKSDILDLVRDGSFVDDFDQWPTGSLTHTEVEFDPESSDHMIKTIPAYRAIELNPSDYNKWKGTGKLPVRARERIIIAFDYYREDSDSVRPEVFCRFYDDTDTEIHSFNAVGNNTGNGWQSVTAAGEAPDGDVTAEIYVIAKDSAATKPSWITNIQARRNGQIQATGDLKITSEVTPTGAESVIGLQAYVSGDTGDRSAAMLLRANTDETSEAVFFTDSFTIANESGDTVPFSIIDDEVYVTTKLSASYLDVDSLLTVLPNAGFSAGGKVGTNNNVTGVWMGREDNGNFGFSVSTNANNKHSYISINEDRTLEISGAKFFQHSGPTVTVTVDTDDAEPVPLLNATQISITAVGGGATAGYTHKAGTDTIIELYDGPTKRETIVARGGEKGEGRYAMGWPMGAWNPWSTTGVRGNPTGPGGGAGGWHRSSPPGKSGEFITGVGVDLSTYTDPRIKVTIGIGAGKNPSYSKTRAAADGRVVYSYLTNTPTEASLLPIDPTAVGSFVTIQNGTNINFPDFGPGIWTIQASEGPINLRRVYFSDTENLRLFDASFASFIANRTPFYNSSGGAAKTIRYAFWSMGS